MARAGPYDLADCSSCCAPATAPYFDPLAVWTTYRDLLFSTGPATARLGVNSVDFGMTNLGAAGAGGVAEGGSRSPKILSGMRNLSVSLGVEDRGLTRRLPRGRLVGRVLHSGEGVLMVGCLYGSRSGYVRSSLFWTVLRGTTDWSVLRVRFVLPEIWERECFGASATVNSAPKHRPTLRFLMCFRQAIEILGPTGFCQGPSLSSLLFPIIGGDSWIIESRKGLQVLDRIRGPLRYRSDEVIVLHIDIGSGFEGLAHER